jgi:hypothetical protein
MRIHFLMSWCVVDGFVGQLLITWQRAVYDAEMFASLIS